MKQDSTLGSYWGPLVGLAMVLLVSMLWLIEGAAQDPPPGQTPQQARVGGSVTVPSDINAGLRRFDAGNKTFWHSHEGGFILFVQEGRARVQRRGELMKELAPGEIDYTPPGVEHWHGAAPGETFVQLGVVPFGGGITFLEPVTDAQYKGESL